MTKTAYFALLTACFPIDKHKNIFPFASYNSKETNSKEQQKGKGKANKVK